MVKNKSRVWPVLGWSVGLLVVLSGSVRFMTQRQEDVRVRDPGNRMYNAPIPTDLTAFSQVQPDAIAKRLNTRPRKTLQYQTPAAKLAASAEYTVA